MRTRAFAVLPVLLILSGCGPAVPSSSTRPVADTTARPSAALETPAPTDLSPSPTGDASPSPSPAASPRPAPATPAYGVLVDLLTSPASYIANLVGVDGRLWASLKLGKRTPLSNQSGHAINLPYVSSTSTALYLLDGDSTVLSLRLPDGKQAFVTKLAAGAGVEAAFAVSPDDKVIAVSILDFSRSPVHVTLYTENLTGGNHHVIFESDSDYVWPVAWHSGLLVLAHAVGPYEDDIAKAAPARDNPYSAVSYHIVDPTNARRVFLLGACTVSGPLSPVGSACIQGGTIDWVGTVSPPWSTHDWGSISSAASLSPDGALVAAAEPDNRSWLGIWRPDGSIAISMDAPDASDWVGWLDGDHIVIGSALHPDWQTRVVTVSNGSAVFVPGAGFYAARLPTDIF